MKEKCLSKSWNRAILLLIHSLLFPLLGISNFVFKILIVIKNNISSKDSQDLSLIKSDKKVFANVPLYNKLKKKRINHFVRSYIPKSMKLWIMSPTNPESIIYRSLPLVCQKNCGHLIYLPFVIQLPIQKRGNKKSLSIAYYRN